MGLFLTVLACKTHSRDKVIRSVIEVMLERKYEIKEKKKVYEITGKENQFEISNSKNDWIQIFSPMIPDDKLVSELSKKLNVPVFQFHIHDGSFWMYQLFVSGNLMDRFNPIPQYWKKLTQRERETWGGNASLISSLFKIEKSKIQPYLVEWDSIRNKEIKIFQKDEFSLMNEWGMIDFQNKLGIIYPEFDKPQTLDLIRLSFKKKYKNA